MLPTTLEAGIERQRPNVDYVVPKIIFGYMASANLTHAADVKTFKKTKEEKEKLINLKFRNRLERKKEYGADFNKHLNTSANRAGLEKPLHFTF
jgi:hypothetical protein